MNTNNPSSDISMGLTGLAPTGLNILQKTGVLLAGIAFLILVVGSSTSAFSVTNALGLSFLALTAGISVFLIGQYRHTHAGIHNNDNAFSSLTSRGVIAWLFSILFTGFYVLLYWFPEYLGLGQDGNINTGFIALFDPLSNWLKNEPASQWFMYGVLYTLAIVLMGIKFIIKYRHLPYQIIRTLSVMFFQLGFAFLIPEWLMRLNLPYNDFKNMWPLNYYFFDNWNIQSMLASGNIGLLMLIWGIAMIFIISPILTYFFGKRWYCSWVCGCGGLAETAGDPFRHLSDKSIKSWRLERWMIHSILILAIIMTIGVIYSYLYDTAEQHWLNKQTFAGLIIILCSGGIFLLWSKRKVWFSTHNKIAFKVAMISAMLIIVLMIWAIWSGGYNVFLIDPGSLRAWYGFYIGAVFSGVIGVGFYPLLGSRVWCRFGCPMAAILGLQQKWFSRFRITVNGGQCISCGNCSTYCEMGIDVKAYAQRSENIIRASCVGCGVCSAVCPRGVLKLENGNLAEKERNTDPIELKDGAIKLKL